MRTSAFDSEASNIRMSLKQATFGERVQKMLFVTIILMTASYHAAVSNVKGQ
jgi:hypothetical protein